MRSVPRVMFALCFSMLALGLADCGGGGGSSPSSNMSGIGTSISNAASSTNPVAASTASPAPGTVTVSVVDYFTNAPITTALVTLDAMTTTGTSASFTPGSGLHALTIAAGGYATYNGAIQTAGGSASRTIPLFPVSPLMQSWLARVNADRAANGRGSVALDDMLTIAAYDHAVDMGTQNYFAHFDPHGFAPTTRSLLLGSMMMAAENIGAGYSSWSAVEDAFMAEKATLQNASASDCANDTGGAGHYCNIVWANHTSVGLAVAQIAGSKYGTYYDQEFGDLYGRYDTSVTANAQDVGSSIDVLLAPAGGAAYQSQALSVMPAPVAIPIATLNADPVCETSCPADDHWYPQSPAAIDGSESAQLSLISAKMYFLAQYTSIVAYVGAGSWALAYPGAVAVPNTYASSAANVTSQSITRQPASSGAIAANPPLRGGSF